jgi:hypothetical protein
LLQRDGENSPPSTGGKLYACGPAAGQIEEVARYCESDVFNTYRVWLVYELFRGAITAEQLAWSETQVREFVATRKSANPHLCAAVAIEKGPP